MAEPLWRPLKKTKRGKFESLLRHVYFSTSQMKITFIASTSIVEATKSPRPDVPASAFIQEVDNNLILEAAEPTPIEADGSF